MKERTAKKLKNGLYIATHESSSSGYASANKGFSTDTEDSRAPSERTLSEFTITNERASPPQPIIRNGNLKHYENQSSSSGGVSDGPMPLSSPPSRPPPRTPSALSYDHGGDLGSDIYVTSAVYKAPSDLSRYTVHRTYHSRPRSIYSASSHRTGRSARSSRSRSRSSRSRTKVEIVRAPNPYCPNLRGVCCIMLLINLGLILLTLGLVIVIQFVEPLFVRILGIVFLIFGAITLIGTFVYCGMMCRDAHKPKKPTDKTYWTKSWQKNIGYTPHEINYKSDRFDERYSDRYSVGKISAKTKSSGRESSNRY